MSRYLLAFAFLLVLYSVAPSNVIGQVAEIKEVTVTTEDDISESAAIAEIKKRIMLDKYRKTPAIALVNTLAKATCYVQGIEECVILGQGNVFQTPQDVLACVSRFTRSSQGPCAIKI